MTVTNKCLMSQSQTSQSRDLRTKENRNLLLRDCRRREINRFLFRCACWLRRSITCPSDLSAYINDLRIRHFVHLYGEAVAAQRFFTVQELASQSGYRNYNTFALAFKQRMGKSVTEWKQDNR